MSDERLEQLRSMLVDEPGDVFLRYAIALELRRSGRVEEAIGDLQALVHDEPGHVPSYYQLALMLADAGRTQDALQACTAGILQSLVTDDRKARSELQALKNAIEDQE
ncbi:MAG: tetratricopeptide repeat protein [Flavobacteriales bacterium]|nr:tetratricopeptide repeat protein [Flavobacteriales bacterium]